MFAENYAVVLELVLKGVYFGAMIVLVLVAVVSMFDERQTRYTVCAEMPKPGRQLVYCALAGVAIFVMLALHRWMETAGLIWPLYLSGMAVMFGFVLLHDLMIYHGQTHWATGAVIMLVIVTLMSCLLTQEPRFAWWMVVCVAVWFLLYDGRAKLFGLSEHDVEMKLQDSAVGLPATEQTVRATAIVAVLAFAVAAARSLLWLISR